MYIYVCICTYVYAHEVKLVDILTSQRLRNDCSISVITTALDQ